MQASRAEFIVGTLVFILLVIAFVIDRVLGWRALGIALAGSGVWAMVTRRIPYGIEGHPPAGYITGVWALVVGGVMVALGLLLAWGARTFDALMVSAHGS